MGGMSSAKNEHQAPQVVTAFIDIVCIGPFSPRGLLLSLTDGMGIHPDILYLKLSKGRASTTD